MSQAMTAKPKRAPAIVLSGDDFFQAAVASIGRGTGCNPEQFERFCLLLCEGVTVARICAEPDMPAWSSLWRYMASVGESAWMDYRRAREVGAHLVAVQAVLEAQQATSNEDAGACRLRFDAYRWYAGKLAPREYGDRLEGATLNTQQTVVFQVTK